jgi:hypothetical protein
MLHNESVVAVFSEHQETDAAVKKLSKAGIAIDHLSVIGKGSHSDEKFIGFHQTGGSLTFWGKRGPFWNGLWHLFGGGLSLTMPAAGHIMVLGYLGGLVVSAVEGTIMVGGLSAFGAALYSAGVPRASVAQYEQAVKADGFLLIVHGTAEDLLRAQRILAQENPSRLDLHDGPTTTLPGSFSVLDAPRSHLGAR